MVQDKTERPPQGKDRSVLSYPHKGKKNQSREV